MPFWLQQRFATSSTESGVAIGLVALSFALSAMLYGRYGSRVAHIPLAGLALALLGGSYLLIALAPTRHVVYAGLLLAGVALGWILPNLNLWLANRTPAALRGRLLGGFSARNLPRPLPFTAAAADAGDSGGDGRPVAARGSGPAGLRRVAGDAAGAAAEDP